MNRASVIDVTVKLAAAAALMSMFWRACAQETDWPIEPVNSDHPIGNTLGEFVVNESGGQYNHEGIDILAVAYPAEGAPFAVVTDDGSVKWVNMIVADSTTNVNESANYVRIQSVSGKREYVYHHLESAMLSLPLRLHFMNTPSGSMNSPAAWPYLVAGDRIAQVHESFACDYNHLHYEVHQVDSVAGNVLLNPLTGVEPRPDAQAPSVKMFLAKDATNPWELFERGQDSQECTMVSGDVDIIAEVGDRDDAGLASAAAGNVGTFELQWRACQADALDCAWIDTHTYDQMSYKWTNPLQSPAKQHFSLAPDLETIPEAWLKSGNACPNNDDARTIVVATNFGLGGSWKTSSGRYPNGKYTVSVRVRDLAGNSAEDSREVCVEN